MKDKLTSRKFWMAVAAFLGSIAATIGGLVTDHEIVAVIGIVCGALSAAIYAAAEAYVDAADASQVNLTVMTDDTRVISQLLDEKVGGTDE